MTKERVAPTSVMFVEDDEDIRELTTLVLERRGYKVLAVATVREACEVFDAHAPEVLVCDLTLPDGSAIEIAGHALREGVARPRLLIALTGHVQPEDHERSREAGFDYHLAKPAATSELCRLIQQHVGRR